MTRKLPPPTNPAKEAGNRLGWPLRFTRPHLTVEEPVPVGEAA